MAAGLKRETLRQLLLRGALVEVNEVEQREVLGTEAERLQALGEA